MLSYVVRRHRVASWRQSKKKRDTYRCNSNRDNEMFSYILLRHMIKCRTTEPRGRDVMTATTTTTGILSTIIHTIPIPIHALIYNKHSDYSHLARWLPFSWRLPREIRWWWWWRRTIVCVFRNRFSRDVGAAKLPTVGFVGCVETYNYSDHDKGVIYVHWMLMTSHNNTRCHRQMFSAVDMNDFWFFHNFVSP